MPRKKKILTAYDIGDVKHDLVGGVLCPLQGRAQLLAECDLSHAPLAAKCAKALPDIVKRLRETIEQLDAMLDTQNKTERRALWDDLAEGCERLDPTGRFTKKAD